MASGESPANAVVAVDANDGCCRDLQDRRRSGRGAAAARCRLCNRGRWCEQRADQKGRRQRRGHQKRGPVGPLESHEEGWARRRCFRTGRQPLSPTRFYLAGSSPALRHLSIAPQPKRFDSLSSSLSRRAADSVWYRIACPVAIPPRQLPLIRRFREVGEVSSETGGLCVWLEGLCACRQGARGRRAHRSPRKYCRYRPRPRSGDLRAGTREAWRRCRRKVASSRRNSRAPITPDCPSARD